MYNFRFLLKKLISKAARAQGFLDPIAFAAQLQRFAQPSEVAAPLELLRLSAVLQARGIMNSQAIQHNLDWVWPYWVVRQFNPRDVSFVPRAFSVTHINMTHRNWTAAGIPDYEGYVLVDPRGLVTPFYDGWSVDAWILTDSGDKLLPSHCDASELHQTLDSKRGLKVITRAETSSGHVRSEVATCLADGNVYCEMKLQAKHSQAGWLAVSLRPYNPEGISFIHKIRKIPEEHSWKVNKKQLLRFGQKPDKELFSSYIEGDVVYKDPFADKQEAEVECAVGMATAMALYRLAPDQERSVTVSIPLEKQAGFSPDPSSTMQSLWQNELRGAVRLQVPDSQIQYLYDTALCSVILHTTQKEVYPGPYTYKHFWFRDSVIILHAMLCVGLTDRAERVFNTFPDRQRVNGYFCSQNGEWDSNGQVLWLVKRFRDLTQRDLDDKWISAIEKAAHWIKAKRMKASEHAHSGLMPSGFSAEHLGPNDYYFWDDFWSVAGLEAASSLLTDSGKSRQGDLYLEEARDLKACTEAALAVAQKRLGHKAMPASPYRRMDSGAISCLAADYPLNLWQPDDERIKATLDYLWENCLVKDGFYHDMSHSGINPYLTLHMAQVLLRRGDARCNDMVGALAKMASATGQWPEAMHPGTGGGCMGDGQHVWASAEWLLMLRNSFVREEGDELILLSGLPKAWLYGNDTLQFGSAPTAFGVIDLKVETVSAQRKLTWNAQWHGHPPKLFFAPLGAERVGLDLDKGEYLLEKPQ